jgi:hypothetical protein
MREATKQKVNLAVKACLERCFGAEDPLVQATDYLERLRRDPAWIDAEIAEVEAMVLKAVTVIVRRPRNDCCSDERPMSAHPPAPAPSATNYVDPPLSGSVTPR